MQRGIIYLTESTISLTLLMAVILFAGVQVWERPSEKTGELYIIQCLHDVLKAQFVKNPGVPDGTPLLDARSLSLDVMASDFRAVFPEKSGFVELDGARIEFGEQDCESISVNAVYYSGLLERHELATLVCIR